MKENVLSQCQSYVCSIHFNLNRILVLEFFGEGALVFLANDILKFVTKGSIFSSCLHDSDSVNSTSLWNKFNCYFCSREKILCFGSITRICCRTNHTSRFWFVGHWSKTFSKALLNEKFLCVEQFQKLFWCVVIYFNIIRYKNSTFFAESLNLIDNMANNTKFDEIRSKINIQCNSDVWMSIIRWFVDLKITYKLSVNLNLFLREFMARNSNCTEFHELC
mmetsp:Transcript_19199/g.24253  ORF Transcript_19199/g.24253 Transcript_19199/m.24253 type:complete len:220 (-) Transcript_19199:2767-3426(-)